MRNKEKAMLISIMMLLFLCSFAVTVQSDSQDVTTSWVIPGDDTISVTYVAYAGAIRFEPDDKNFTDRSAEGQDSGTPAINVTNLGNQNLIINGSWDTDWETGIEYVNISIDDWSDNTTYGTDWLSYGDSNETVNQTWVASLAMDTGEDFWFWTTGHEVAQGTHNTNLVVWSDPA